MLFDRDGAGADYEQVIFARGRGGLRAVLAIHSTRLGPAFGGIRRRRYRDEDEAVSEVLGLARSMTHKCSLAGLRAGGAKTVILDHERLEPELAYEALGELVEGLGGRYVCGPDVGTGSAELAAVRRATGHVNPKENDAGASTAAGVVAGIRGVLRVLDGDADLGAQRYAIQGLGSVGLSVARTLLSAGARVWGADPRAEAREMAARAGVEIVGTDDVLGTPCDVVVPCALGKVLTRETVAALRCRAVCGSANEQLADGDAAAVLQSRRIAHAPDVVVSAGAVIEGVLTVSNGLGDVTRANVRAAIDRIEQTTHDVIEAANREGRTPTDVALRQARDRVAASDGGGVG